MTMSRLPKPLLKNQVSGTLSSAATETEMEWSALPSPPQTPQSSSIGDIVCIDAVKLEIDTIENNSAVRGVEPEIIRTDGLASFVASEFVDYEPQTRFQLRKRLQGDCGGGMSPVAEQFGAAALTRLGVNIC